MNEHARSKDFVQTSTEEERRRESETPDQVRAFAPLDPNEQSPGPPLRENRRGLQLYRVNQEHRRLSRRELAAVLSLPTLFFLLILLGHAKLSTVLNVGIVLLFVVGIVVFASSGRRT
jgi:hypothetical protein